MKPQIAIAACAGLLALVATTAARTQPLKCPPGTPVMFPDAPEPAYVINGKAADSAGLRTLKPASIESLEMVCADALYRVFGVKAQRTGVVIYTTPGPSAALKATMAAVNELQEKFYAQHGRFAKTVAELGWSDPSGMITVDISVAEDGTRWSATGRHRQELRPSGQTVWGFKK